MYVTWHNVSDFVPFPRVRLHDKDLAVARTERDNLWDENVHEWSEWCEGFRYTMRAFVPRRPVSYYPNGARIEENPRLNITLI